MKIRSWTGKEVEARVGMVVLFKNDRGSSEFTVDAINRDDLLDGAGFWWSANECTMLFAPLQQDDPIEVFEMGVFVNNGDIYSGSEYAKRCHEQGLTRHAAPDLRPSPDYVKEV